MVVTWCVIVLLPSVVSGVGAGFVIWCPAGDVAEPPSKVGEKLADRHFKGP
jgi:hypothetical protein